MCHWHVAQPQPPTPAVMEQLLGYVRFKLMHAEFIKEHVLSSPRMESKRFINVLVVALLEPVVSPRKADLPRGVQRNLPSSFLDGWTRHYEEPYSHKTPSEILDSIPESAKHVLVGALAPDSSIALCATCQRAAILCTTTSREVAQKHNRAFWLRVEMYAFGFSPIVSIYGDNAEDIYKKIIYS